MEPPKGLGLAGIELWSDLVSVFDFEADPHRLSLLEELCRTKDLCVRLQQDIDEAESLEVIGSMGQPVVMGQVSELRQMRSLVASLIKALGLPDTAELAAAKKAHLSLVRGNAAKKRRVSL